MPTREAESFIYGCNLDYATGNNYFMGAQQKSTSEPHQIE